MITLPPRSAEGVHLYALKDLPTGPYVAINEMLAGQTVSHDRTHRAIDALIEGGADELTALILVDWAIRKGRGVAA
jgi:hypothetical protein